MVGKTPFVSAVIAGVPVKFLVDTGSMVSIISREFFEKNLKPLVGAPESPVSWLQLKAANGLEMPYDGYVTLDVQVLGHKLPSRGILITRDSPSAADGLLGGNVLEGLPEFQHFFDKSES